jgi:hypothetical protein
MTLEEIVRAVAVGPWFDEEYGVCYYCAARATTLEPSSVEHLETCPYAAAVAWVAEHPEQRRCPGCGYLEDPTWVVVGEIPPHWTTAGDPPVLVDCPAVGQPWSPHAEP